MRKACVFFVLLSSVCVIAKRPCETLHSAYTGAGRFVRIDHKEQDVVVFGGGASARAAAFLLLAGIRHVLKYSARFDATDADVCQLAAERNKSMVLAPAAILNKFGYSTRDCSIDDIANLNIPAAVNINQQFLARISFKTNCKIVPCWTSLKNTTLGCDFLTSEYLNITGGKLVKICKELQCVPVLARNETKYDQRILQEFKKRIISTNLGYIDIITFQNDQMFRQKIFQLRNLDFAFLFIDENLWTTEEDVIRLEVPPCLKLDDNCPIDSGLNLATTIRIGNGFLVKEYAPPIYRMINNFSPKNEHIKEILKYEYDSTDTTSTEEAACYWAINNKNEFEEWFGVDNKRPQYPPAFEIYVFLCIDDPYNELYKEVQKIVGLYLWDIIHELDYVIKSSSINCTESHKLPLSLYGLSRKKNQLAGAIAWSWTEGVTEASNVVKFTNIPLMLVGPAKESLLGEATFAPSGRLSDIAKSYYHFLSRCKWKRVAIISDDKSYSKSFVKAILSEGKLNYAEAVVTQETLSSTLNKFKSQDARIIIVNTDCKLADAIFSEAITFTPLNNYIWLVRDWCIIKDRKNIDGLSHFTLELSWRGGHFLSGSHKLRSNLNEHNLTWKNYTITPGISQLTDALMQLGQGFAAYRKADISRRYDLHGPETAKDFHKVVSEMDTIGVAQNLTFKNYARHEPLIFVSKWQGNERRSIAIWKIVNNSVTEEWSAINNTDKCFSLLDAERVRDSSFCVISSGDAFAPRCHDIVLGIFLLSLIVICTAIVASQKLRAKRLAEENKALVARLLESRQKNASALSEFLVERGSIRLIHEIGSGCYGRVYFAELTRPETGTLIVAAKEPHKNYVSMMEENEILREACILARLEHNNVIRLMGVCLAGGPPIVLMEHAIYLDLQRYLTERRHLALRARHGVDTDDFELSDETLTQLACDASSALEYLADHRLVHRDIRAANCLIDKQRSLKLADFGMARDLDDDVPTYITCRKALFPVLWMAPESLEHGVFSLASDVWAAGVLLLEIATIGSRPYGDWSTLHVVRHVMGGGRPPLPTDLSMCMRKILYKCWYREPEKRITATELRQYMLQNPKLISPTLLAPELPLSSPSQQTHINFLT